MIPSHESTKGDMQYSSPVQPNAKYRWAPQLSVLLNRFYSTNITLSFSSITTTVNELGVNAALPSVYDSQPRYQRYNVSSAAASFWVKTCFKTNFSFYFKLRRSTSIQTSGGRSSFVPGSATDVRRNKTAIVLHYRVFRGRFR
jgi:hypothetical protein